MEDKMGDATFPIFNNHMFIIIKSKVYGGGVGILDLTVPPNLIIGLFYPYL